VGSHRDTLFASLLQVGGNVWLNRGFESYGAVNFGGAKIGGNLHFDSGHFIHPNNPAISAPGASIDDVVFLKSFGRRRCRGHWAREFFLRSRRR
jgi:hypothetical protein